MARRAVQGYSEKTYFENSRFGGMLATNDPQLEGYFKHLVNFDISDTGQSAKPRQGYLTTGPAKTPEYTLEVEYADLSQFPTTGVVTTRYTAVDTGLKYSWDTSKYVRIVPNIISLSDHTVVYKDNNTQKHILYDFESSRGFLVDVSRYNIEDKLIPFYTEVAAYDWSNAIDIFRTKLTAVEAVYVSYYDATLTVAETRAKQLSGTLAYIRQHITILSETIVPNAIDQYGIPKTIFKVVLEDTEEVIDSTLIEETYFMIAMYYREHLNTYVTPNLSANTLVFDALDMDYTEYVEDRNIASTKSLIPETMQTLYTPATRPDGNVTVLDLIYVNDVDVAGDPDSYYNEIVPRSWLEFTPHFVLDPASNTFNDAAALWAYRFDITSLTPGVPDFKGNWFRYTGPADAPVALFAMPTGSVVTPKADAHYEGAHYIITLVPYDYDDSEDLSLLEADTVPTPVSWTEAEARYTAWKAIIDSTVILDKKTLLAALDDLEELAVVNRPRIHIRDTREVTSEFTLDTQFIENNDEIITTVARTADEYDEHFIEVSAFRDLVESETYDEMNFAWRLLPVSYYIIRTDGAEQHSWLFKYAGYSSNTILGVVPESHINTYDRFDDLIDKDDFATLEAAIYTLGFSNDTFTAANMPPFASLNYFSTGFVIKFYIKPYLPSEFTDKTLEEKRQMKESWIGPGSKVTSRNVIYAIDTAAVSEIIEYQEDDPERIQKSHSMINFEDNIMITWADNVLYISDPGEFNYYIPQNKFTYGEKIVKVLEYKTILLVFTVQHLYAVYKDVEESTITNSDDSVTTTETPFWASQKVLYNILTSEKYADVIQVFNEFVLFYSEDGQLFLIKPNVMIDSETRFSLKYFNQAANDVLLNYDDYINERLSNYNIAHSVTKDDVQIKALVSINFIKIFFYVPGYITYILRFDVIANRFNVYDTIAFTDIVDKSFIDSGEMYITRQNSKLYFTIPYKEPNVMDNMVDMSLSNNFEKIAISGLLDTGNMSLNNHLRKRFQKLHTIFKNLSTSKLLYNVETEIDDIVSHPFYDTQLEVHDIGGTSYYVTVPKTDNNDLIDLIGDNQISDAGAAAFVYAMENSIYDESSILMDFAEFTSSKLLTHRSSILGMGKVLRLKMQFISKGDYKIQSFGVVYKERRV